MTSETDIIFGDGQDDEDDREIITPGDPDITGVFGEAPIAKDDLITRSVLDFQYGYYPDPVTGERQYGYFLSGYLFVGNGSGRDVDPEGDPFQVYAVNGGSPTFSLTDVNGGGEVGVSTWGSFIYRSDTNLAHLAEGQTLGVSFTYSISDGGGGSVGVATLVIEGANDAPGGETLRVVTDVDTPINVFDLMDQVGDPDDGAAVSFVSLAPTGTIHFDWSYYEISDGGIRFDPRGAYD